MAGQLGSESRRMHLQLYSTVGDNLPPGSSDFKQFVHFIPLDPRDREGKERAEDLLQVWESRGGVSIGKYKKLLGVLKDAKLIKLHDTVKVQDAAIQKQLKAERHTGSKSVGSPDRLQNKGRKSTRLSKSKDSGLSGKISKSESAVRTPATNKTVPTNTTLPGRGRASKRRSDSKVSAPLPKTSKRESTVGLRTPAMNKTVSATLPGNGRASKRRGDSKVSAPLAKTSKRESTVGLRTQAMNKSVSATLPGNGCTSTGQIPSPNKTSPLRAALLETTLKQAFGPFLKTTEIQDMFGLSKRACHEVKLFGKVLNIFRPDPNKMEPGEKRRHPVNSRKKHYIVIQFEVKTDGEKQILTLKAFLDSVKRFNKIFKKNKSYIICGVQIQKSSPKYESRHEYQGILHHSFVHQLSPKADLDSTVRDEKILGTSVDQIPLVLLTDITEWAPNQYIEGRVIHHSWTSEEKQWYKITLCDSTGTVDLIAGGHRGKELAQRGRIKLDQIINVVKGNGKIAQTSQFSRSSLPVDLIVGPNTKIRP